MTKGMTEEEGFDHVAWEKRQREFAAYFPKEAWTLFGVVCVVILIRYYSRYHRFGFRGSKLDDLLNLLAFACYAALTYGIDMLMQTGAESSFMPAEIVQFMDEAEIESIMYSGKWDFAIKHLNVAVMWCVKFCLLVVYARITDGLRVKRYIILAAGYTALSLVVNELTLLLTCWPVQRRWTPPNSSRDCAFYDNYQIAEGVLSVSSSAIIFLVGFPVIANIQLPPRQKFIVMLLFGLALFDIVASILTKVYSVFSGAFGFICYIWFIRETSVALLVCNLPFVWSLIVDLFPSVKAWSCARPKGSRGAIQFWNSSNASKISLFSFTRRRNRGGDGACKCGALRDLPSFTTASVGSEDVEKGGHGEGVIHVDTVLRVGSEKAESIVLESEILGRGKQGVEYRESYLDLDEPHVFVNAVARSVSATRVPRYGSRMDPDVGLAVSPPDSRASDGVLLRK